METVCNSFPDNAGKPIVCDFFLDYCSAKRRKRILIPVYESQNVKTGQLSTKANQLFLDTSLLLNPDIYCRLMQ